VDGLLLLCWDACLPFHERESVCSLLSLSLLL
jgi:hypothetical protein